MPTAVDLAKDWAIGAVLGAALTVGAPFVAAGVTTIGAYKYGPKIVNAVVSGARKIVGCRKGAQYFNKSEKIASNGAESVNAGINLNRKLSQLENAQQTASRTRYLPDGRIRYYDAERSARTSGATRGSSYVVEYNPKNGNVRGWNECYDHFGKVNRVHPKDINGKVIKVPHYPPTWKELSR